MFDRFISLLKLKTDAPSAATIFSGMSPADLPQALEMLQEAGRRSQAAALDLLDELPEREGLILSCSLHHDVHAVMERYRREAFRCNGGRTPSNAARSLAYARKSGVSLLEI
jgi:hypothetical protein